MARKAALKATDSQDNLSVLYHPQRHPDAHERPTELLHNAGVRIEEYSRASNPFEMQTLVKDGHGLTLICEGARMDEELTTRPIAGVDWTVSTAAIYHKQQHPKTIPVLIRNFERRFTNLKEDGSGKTSVPMRAARAIGPMASAIAFSGIAHAQGSMDFSGATTSWGHSKLLPSMRALSSVLAA